jgi:hypothetical protein
MPIHRPPLPALIAGLALLAGCALEPGTTQERTRAELGLGQDTAATLTLGGASGAATVQCGAFIAGVPDDFGVRLAPQKAPGSRVAVEVAAFHGPGTYDGALTLRRVDSDGTLDVSHGKAELRLADATETAGAHAVSGSLQGHFDGAAGSGDVSADFQRCYFFD